MELADPPDAFFFDVLVLVGAQQYATGGQLLARWAMRTARRPRLASSRSLQIAATCRPFSPPNSLREWAHTLKALDELERAKELRALDLVWISLAAHVRRAQGRAEISGVAALTGSGRFDGEGIGEGQWNRFRARLGASEQPIHERRRRRMRASSPDGGRSGVIGRRPKRSASWQLHM